MDSETPIWATALAVNLGAFTLVSWLVRRVFTHTIPRLAGSFEKERQGLSEQYQRLLSEQRADFQDALESQRKVFAEQLATQREDFQKQMDRQRTDFVIAQNEQRVDHKESITQLINTLSKGTVHG